MAKKASSESSSSSIASHIPELGLSLSKYTGSELIDRLGEDVVKETVIGVLFGNNIRSLTEALTQRRISLSNASLLITYLRAFKSIPNFSEDLLQLIKNEITTKGVAKERKVFLQWFAGLTGKGVQNILRGDANGELKEYIEILEKTLENSVIQATSEYGDINAVIEIDGDEISLGWLSFIQIMIAVGTQTLAIRGSEKSMYGKLFEKLILGSALSVLGFEMIKKDDTSKSSNVFWLSERGDKRESDATLLFAPGKGIRFDIGFIGPGNTEISLDKVTRFDKEMMKGGSAHSMQTIILVDRIGDGSRIVDMAKEIGGSIIQMSMTNWVQALAALLKECFPAYKNKFHNVSDIEFQNLVNEEMKHIDLRKFIGDFEEEKEPE